MLTTQILSEAEELCDDILIMNHGRQVARGDLHALKLLSRALRRDGDLRALPEDLRPSCAALRPARASRDAQHRASSKLKDDERRVLELVEPRSPGAGACCGSRSAAPASRTSSSS